MSNSRKGSLSVQYMTRIAILGALASILFMIEIPVIAFYKLDLSTIPVLLGAFSMGPLPGMAILLIKDLTGMLHSTSGFVGELADFIMSAAYVLPAAVIYRMCKSRKGALTGMIVGTLLMIVVAVLVNWKIMIPFYMGAFHKTLDEIVGMAQDVLPFVDTELKLLLCVTAPFNVLKGVVLSVVTYLIYKPLSPMLKVRK